MPAPDRTLTIVGRGTRDGSPVEIEHALDDPAGHGRDVVALAFWYRFGPLLPPDTTWEIRVPPCPLLTALRSGSSRPARGAP